MKTEFTETEIKAMVAHKYNGQGEFSGLTKDGGVLVKLGKTYTQIKKSEVPQAVKRSQHTIDTSLNDLAKERNLKESAADAQKRQDARDAVSAEVQARRDARDAESKFDNFSTRDL